MQSSLKDGRLGFMKRQNQLAVAKLPLVSEAAILKTRYKRLQPLIKNRETVWPSGKAFGW